jgi:hypothetical protein
MSEDAVRAAAEAAIARHLARRGSGPAARRPDAAPGHPSFTLCVVPAGGDGEDACLVEPSVPCTHCGFCRTHGY